MGNICKKSRNINFNSKIYYETEKELDNLTLDNTPKFSFENEIHLCKVLDVYDGDTIKVAFKLINTDNYIYYSIRLLDIDTPEIRTKNKKEKEKGLQARDYLRNLILHKNIILVCNKFGKYGRILGTIYFNLDDMYENKSINDIMKKFSKY